jgi:hypothetical protein
LIRGLRCAGLAALTLYAAACAQTFDSVELGVPVSLAEATTTPVSGDSFRVTRHPVWVLYGLIPAAQPSLEDVLAGQAGTGKRIANLKIRQRMRWSDLLITVLTLGLASPRSVTFEGVVIPR